MKTRHLLPLLLAPLAAFAADSGFKSIFNGKDLTGWNGDPRLWAVKDGVIHGETTAENPAKGNTFLIWNEDTLKNFDLRLSFRCSASNNSGIQYRSKLVDADKFVVGGYQADFEAGKTPAPGSATGRQGSAPEGGPTTLTDPSLYDGSKARPMRFAISSRRTSHDGCATSSAKRAVGSMG